jgi:hypothetical protein
MQIPKIPWFVLIITIAFTSLSFAENLRIFEKDGCFQKYRDGVILDTCTGFEWLPGPDRAMIWEEAREWVRSLDGERWRMPAEEELDTLYRIADGARQIAPVFDNSGYWIWAGSTQDAASQWLFRFSYGGEGWSGRPHPDGGRALAVRKRK